LIEEKREGKYELMLFKGREKKKENFFSCVVS